MNYCNHCGSKNLVFKIPAGDHAKRWVCEKCETIHYINPNMVVGCLIEHNGKVMLAKRGIEPRKGFWNLPCGFLENNETVEEGALREVMEETGASVEISHLHTIYNLTKANQVYLIYYALMTSPGFNTTEESTEICFFDEEEVPWNEIAFTSNTFALKKHFEKKEKKEKILFSGSFPEIS